MQLRVLGCSGGIGGSLRTTSFLVDHDILIDAGTGVGDLTLAELKQIDHIFVTHAHLDHVTSIPFLVDTVGGMRAGPITVHAAHETIDILRAHLFNWKLWPDFTEIPSREAPYLRFAPFGMDDVVELRGRKIRPLPANHVVPAVGFHLDSGAGSLVFTGDTTVCAALWEQVNRIDNLHYLLIETAFSNAEHDLAVASRHLTPDMLAAELAKLERPVRVFISHLKPGEGALTMEQVEAVAGAWSPRMLSNGQVLKF
jgi:ribonuclease BN (tRNA processing enzyme)